MYSSAYIKSTNVPSLSQNLYESIKSEPFKIPEDDGNDLTHTFFNPDREGWLLKLGQNQTLSAPLADIFCRDVVLHCGLLEPVGGVRESCEHSAAHYHPNGFFTSLRGIPSAEVRRLIVTESLTHRVRATHEKCAV